MKFSVFCNYSKFLKKLVYFKVFLYIFKKIGFLVFFLDFLKKVRVFQIIFRDF